MHNHFLNLAIKLSRKSDYYQKIGCVIVKKKKIISFGYNKPYKTHPKSTNNYHTIHAELDACLGVSHEELIGSVAYVAREHKGDGSYILAKPCYHCQELLKSQGVKKVYYTTRLGFEMMRL